MVKVLAKPGGPRRLVSSEEQIHRAVVDHLRTRAPAHVFWSHVPAGELRHRAVGGKLVGLGLKPGIPDLLLVIHGIAYFLELKREGGRLSQVQQATQAQLRAAGAVVETTYGLDEAIGVLKRWGALR